MQYIIYNNWKWGLEGTIRKTLQELQVSRVTAKIGKSSQTVKNNLMDGCVEHYFWNLVTVWWHGCSCSQQLPAVNRCILDQSNLNSTTRWWVCDKDDPVRKGSKAPSVKNSKVWRNWTQPGSNSVHKSGCPDELLCAEEAISNFLNFLCTMQTTEGSRFCIDRPHAPLRT